MFILAKVVISLVFGFATVTFECLHCVLRLIDIWGVCYLCVRVACDQLELPGSCVYASIRDSSRVVCNSDPGLDALSN